MSAARQFRELLKSDELLVSPGVYDGYSIRLVEAAGFKTACTSGAAISNALLGIADIGVMGLTENAAHCRNLARSVSIPLTADADNGYGNPVNVYHTVRVFEEAGVAGVNLEDQVSPKRCGHMHGKELVDRREAAKKIEAAVAAKTDPGFIVNARTDAIAVEGFDAAVERAKLYVAAGADMVYPDAIRSEDQIKRFVEEVGAPVSINMGFGTRNRPTTPLLSVKRLGELGVARATFARMLPAAAIMGMMKVLELLRDGAETGTVHDRPDLQVGMEEITDLMGYGLIDRLEQEFLLEEDLVRKYGEGERSYVVHG